MTLKMSCQTPFYQTKNVHGTDPAANSVSSQRHLVDTKLEMVRANGLPQFVGALRALRLLYRPNRFWGDEVDRCLQGCAGQSQSEPGGDRSARVADQRGAFRFRKHKCERRFGRSQPLHPDFRSQRKSNDLLEGREVARSLELYRSRGRDREDRRTNRSKEDGRGGRAVMSEQVPIASTRLSVSAVLFAIIGGIAGIALGLGLGLLIGGALAAAFHANARFATSWRVRIGKKRATVYVWR